MPVGAEQVGVRIVLLRFILAKGSLAGNASSSLGRTLFSISGNSLLESGLGKYIRAFFGWFPAT